MHETPRSTTWDQTVSKTHRFMHEAIIWHIKATTSMHKHDDSKAQKYSVQAKAYRHNNTQCANIARAHRQGMKHNKEKQNTSGQSVRAQITTSTARKNTNAWHINKAHTEQYKHHKSGGSTSIADNAASTAEACE